MLEAIGGITLFAVLIFIVLYFTSKNDRTSQNEREIESQEKQLDKETNHQIFKEYQWIVEQIFKKNDQYPYDEFLNKVRDYKPDFSEKLLLSRFYNAGLVDIVKHRSTNIIYRKGKGYTVPENIHPEIIRVFKSIRNKFNFYNPSSNTLKCRLLSATSNGTNLNHVGEIILGIYTGEFIENNLFKFPNLEKENFYFVIHCNMDPSYRHMVKTSLAKTTDQVFFSTPLLLNNTMTSESFFLNTINEYVKNLGINNFKISGYKN